jgi:hypothetical protein
MPDTRPASVWAAERGVAASGTDTDRTECFEYIGTDCQQTTPVFEYPSDPVVFDYAWERPLDTTRPSPPDYILLVTPRNLGVQTIAKEHPPGSGLYTTCAISVVESLPPIRIPVRVLPWPCSVQPLPSLEPLSGTIPVNVIDSTPCEDNSGSATLYNGTVSYEKCWKEQSMFGKITAPCGEGITYSQGTAVTITKSVSIHAGLSKIVVLSAGFTTSEGQTNTTQYALPISATPCRIKKLRAFQAKTSAYWTLNKRDLPCGETDPSMGGQPTLMQLQTTHYSNDVNVILMEYSDPHHVNPCGNPAHFDPCERG